MEKCVLIVHGGAWAIPDNRIGNQPERGQLAVYCTSPQSFIITITYSL